MTPAEYVAALPEGRRAAVNTAAIDVLTMVLRLSRIDPEDRPVVVEGLKQLLATEHPPMRARLASAVAMLRPLLDAIEEGSR